MNVNSNDREDPGERVDVTIRFATMRQLQAELGPELATDGLFIRTDDPAPVNSDIGLRVMLPDDFVAFQASGVVIWRREPGSEDGPPGMAVKYSLVPRESRATLDAIIDAHLAAGGELFDLSGAAAGGDTFPTDALGSTGRRSTRSAEIVEQLESARSMLDQQSPDPPEPAADDGDDLRDRALFEAISRAVSAPLSGSHDPDENTVFPDDSAGGAPAVADADEGEQAIPQILDRLEQLREQRQSEPFPLAEEDDDEPPSFASDPAPHERDRAPEPDGQPMVPPPSMVETDSVEEADGGKATTSPMTGGGSRPGFWLAVAAVVVIACLAGLMLWNRGSGGVDEGVSIPVGQETGPVADDAAPATEASSDEYSPGSPAAIAHEVEGTASVGPEVPPATGPASIVRAVTCEPEDGRTRIAIEANGSVDEASVSLVSLADPPRILVRLKGIEQDFKPYRIEVGSAELLRVRIGFHPEELPPELYVVLDLTDEAVGIAESELSGNTVRLSIARR
jgi:hypothetical protein